MANTSRRPRLRAQVYVHLEFGVSWNTDEPLRNHAVTYRSRALRERHPPFPRQVPAPNTNYLSNAPAQHAPVPYDWDLFHGYYAPPLPPPRHNRDDHGEDDGGPRRSCRADSRSSHERGQSAPPPIGSNPWDVDVSQPRQAAHQSASTSQRQPPEARGASSAEAPARFRLGEDSLPWGAWSVPYGYDPEAHPQDDESAQAAPPSAAGRSDSNVACATSPTEVSTFSPGPSGPGFRRDDPGRVHELSRLGAALMTVDNGFENQWWYQGRREAVHTGDVVGETIRSPQRFARDSLGWAVAASAALGHGLDGLTPATTSDAVSPLPSFVSPASPTAAPARTRSLSTRSDELFFTERSRGSLAG